MPTNKPHVVRSAAGDRLLIIVTHFGGVATLAVHGEIDAHNVNCFRDSVMAVCELGVPVMVDMDQVTFMDSTGIAALITASAFAQELSSSVRVTRPSTQVHRVLAITGLDRVFLGHRAVQTCESVDALSDSIERPA